MQAPGYQLRDDGQVEEIFRILHTKSLIIINRLTCPKPHVRPGESDKFQSLQEGFMASRLEPDRLIEEAAALSRLQLYNFTKYNSV
ncbi:hypothetical protein Zmor_009451 [Zophobas morio]|uniref:Uncharacterized protein n=1 Tax=Zophobas morio TaxID=2755281 RepID=A0AA38IMI4_9CUCU|nr:hypothetical protein Zmor_009451 [Zophobas morio]